ncbi:unnamed protein product [Spirodela intermedia]|uniref:Uncharacterized protein n=1 Tax=Spirodela intermedia TaxID=51605 RepID=A0A7I8K7X8_SPIIN|nr:unnamed protein product [Spirodela intermedia]
MGFAEEKGSNVLFAKTSCFGEEHGSRQALLPKEGKEGSLENARKLELVDYDSLPKYLKHNEFILRYYRCEWPLKDAILSIFSIHNETVNVWTHLIGFFLFLSLTLYAAMMIPTVANSLYAQQPHSGVESPFSSLSNTSGFGSIFKEINTSSSQTSMPHPQFHDYFGKIFAARNGDESAAAPSGQAISRWPFFAFLCGAMFCLLTSSACHLLSCHSEHTSYVMLRLDYAGISALIVTSIFPQVYYTFACEPFYQTVYTAGITTLGVLTVLVSLIPFFETPEFRIVRSLVFVCMALSGWGPIVHKLMLFGNRPEALLTTLYEFLMNSCYGIGVVIYATRVPERWSPGKFDLIGHSHQLFHVLVIAGAYIQYLAMLVYLQWRDAEGC